MAVRTTLVGMQDSSPRGLVAWLAPGVLLGGVLVGVALVRGGSSAWFGLVIGALVVVPAAWVLISALHPARAERRCPACAAEALERCSADSTTGLRCRSCSWTDPEASAWTLAEEEGPLERMVLAARGRKDAPAPTGHMDSPARRG